jgi:hypothetical protein
MTAIVRSGLSDLVVSAWAGFDAVQASAAKSRQHPVDPMFVPLANHRATRSFAPRLDVYLDEALLARFVLQAHVELALSGVILKLLAGRIVSVGAGTWAGTGTLSCNGAELARRTTGPKSLPGAIALGDGIAIGTEPTVEALTLVVEPAPRTGPSTVTVGTAVIIGRHPSCQAILAEDAGVAAHHAVVYPLGELTVLEDLGSLTGTRFNGHRITAPAILHDGDEIGIGGHCIKVSAGSPSRQTATPKATVTA